MNNKKQNSENIYSFIYLFSTDTGYNFQNSTKQGNKSTQKVQVEE